MRGDVIRGQQDLNDLCRRNTQLAQIRQKGGLIKGLQIPGSSSTKRNQKIIKEMARPISDNRLSTGRAAHYENIKAHNASSEDWCIPADMQEGDYLIVDPACEVNEKGTRDKNDGNEVVDYCDLPLDLELTERVEVDDETLPYAEED